MRPARRRPASAAADRAAAAKQASKKRSVYPCFLYIIGVIFSIIIGYEIYILFRNSSYLQLPQTPAEFQKNSEGDAIIIQDDIAKPDIVSGNDESKSETSGGSPGKNIMMYLNLCIQMNGKKFC